MAVTYESKNSGWQGPTGYTGPAGATVYTGYTGTTGYTGYTGYVFVSDSRLKRNITLVGQRKGFNLYEFSYVWDLSRRYVGVMAQEVLLKAPQAVRGIGKWLAVDYRQLGIPFRQVT